MRYVPLIYKAYKDNYLATNLLFELTIFQLTVTNSIYTKIPPQVEECMLDIPNLEYKNIKTPKTKPW